MAKKQTPQDRLHAMVAEVEALAKNLRADLRKRASATGIEKELRKSAARLQKTAGGVAAKLEAHVGSLRKQAEKAMAQARKAIGAGTAKKPAAKRKRSAPKKTV